MKLDETNLTFIFISNHWKNVMVGTYLQSAKRKMLKLECTSRPSRIIDIKRLNNDAEYWCKVTLPIWYGLNKSTYIVNHDTIDTVIHYLKWIITFGREYKSSSPVSMINVQTIILSSVCYINIYHYIRLCILIVNKSSLQTML